MERFIGFIVAHRWLALLFSFSFIITCAAGLRYFTIESDYEVFFDGTNPRLQAHQQLEVEYGRKDAVRIGIAPRSGDVFDPAVLSAMIELTQAAWKIPHSNRVESLTNFQYVRNQDGELLTGDLFENVAAMSAEEMAKRRAFALSDPAIVNMYVNPAGSVAGLQVLITLPDGDARATSTITAFSRELLDDFAKRHPEIDFYLTGSIVTNDAFFQASTTETARLMGLMLVVGLLLLAVLLRSAAVVLIGLALVVGASLAGLGLASWLRLPFTAFSASALLVAIAVVIASSVHVLAQLLAERRAGQEKTAAVHRAMLQNWKPLVLTSFTTAAGLLCLNFSDIPPSRYLGTTAAFSVLACLVLTFTLLPALACVLPAGKVKAAATGSNVWERLADFVIARRLGVAVTMIAIGLSLAAFVPRNEINDSLLRYFDESVDFRRESDFLMQNLFYFYSMDISIPSGAEYGINDPEYMQKIDELAQWARGQAEVYTVLTFTDVLKNLNRAIHDGDPAWYRLPDEKSAAADFMLMYEMSVPFGLDLNNQLNVDRSAAKIIIGFRDVSGNQLIAFDQRIQAWMAENFPPPMQAIPAGPSLMFANIWGDAARSNLEGMVIAILVVSAIIAIGMRSLGLGLLCLLPNVLPALMAFGLWAIVDGRIDMGASVVAIIAFGIVVDDTIHFISRFRHGMTVLAQSAEEAVRYAMRTVGRAISISTVVLVCGFAVLAQSHFALNAKVGLLTCILLVFALILDLFLLPAMLLMIYRQSSAPHSSHSIAASVERDTVEALADAGA